ncbi:hypothetical protein RF11_14749 [Thelohanellus kitauei]|uniref:Vacuolar protein sorting/targeting protein 10 n=1 Tax=Thelohanellus kitauei TaxID=669202 RepID=A0A0C2MX87_THEKT|nr:hypothetical protein RF11_14749 [Thelohanellus kitauei]
MYKRCRGFRILRGSFILVGYSLLKTANERVQTVEKDMIIGIGHNQTFKEITTKIIHLNQLYARADLSIYKKVDEYFYLHGMLYILAWKKGSNLCLFTFNEYDQFIEIVCGLSKNNLADHRCSFVINPHVAGVIYANLNKIKDQTRTYVSFDHGKNFVPLQLKRGQSNCRENNCVIEFDLLCHDDLIENNFPEKWILKFRGTYHRKSSASRHIFISTNGGKNWKMLASRIENLIILNSGGLMFGTERQIGRIMFSYDEGMNWYYGNISTNNLRAIIPLEWPTNLAITGINYDQHKETCTFLQFDFSHKKPSSLCFDNRTMVQLTIKPCPCSLEDFPWYQNFNHSKPNYYYNDNFCIWNPFSNITEPVKQCRDGGIPLNDLNGYEAF